MIKEFETNNLKTLEIAKILKEHIVSVEKFIFKINPIEIEASYKILQPYLLDRTKDYEKSIGYQNLLRSLDEFRAFLEERYSHFSEPSKLLEGNQKEEYYTNAYNFLLIAFESLKRYMPWSEDKAFMLVDAFLLPKGSENQVVVKFQKLAERFTNVILENDRVAWGQEIISIESKIGYLQTSLEREQKDYTTIWRGVSGRFALLYKLARAVYVLSYSTADIERTFSRAEIVKNTRRNKLSTQRLEACLLARQYFGKEGYYFTSEMTALYNKKLDTKDSNLRQIAETNEESVNNTNITNISERKEGNFAILLTNSQEEGNRIFQEIITKPTNKEQTNPHKCKKTIPFEERKNIQSPKISEKNEKMTKIGRN